MPSFVSIEQRNPFMLQYISWPEFSQWSIENYRDGTVTTRSTTSTMHIIGYIALGYICTCFMLDFVTLQLYGKYTLHL